MKIELTPFSTFLWSLFLLFLLSWVFVLGILAGKGLLPGAISGIENPFKKFKESLTQKEAYKYKKPDEDLKLNFYDNLESKKNEVKKKITIPKENTPSQQITLSRGEKDEKAEESKPAETVREKQYAPVPEVVPQGVFSVQLASVSTPESAQRVTKELVDKDFDAYYYSATVDGKKIYRIMCGRFEKRSDAVLCLNRLKLNTGYKKGFIVKVEK